MNNVYIDWLEYDRLKKLGWQDRKIAKVFNMSPGTLCTKKKKRAKKIKCIK